MVYFVQDRYENNQIKILWIKIGISLYCTQSKIRIQNLDRSQKHNDRFSILGSGMYLRIDEGKIKSPVVDLGILVNKNSCSVL